MSRPLLKVAIQRRAFLSHAFFSQKRDVYHEHFQFGWMGNGELVNSILMGRIALPFLLVLNSSTFHHHVPEDEPYEMTVEAIESFLEQIRNETSPVSSDA